MEPLQEPAHVVAGRRSRSTWLDPKNAVAVGCWPKQHLLKVEPGRLDNDRGRLTRLRDCNLACLGAVRCNAYELDDIGRNWRDSRGPGKNRHSSQIESQIDHMPLGHCLAP